LVVDTSRGHLDADNARPGSRVYFQQGCPVCGRRLEIDVNLLGRRVYCQHCGGGFVAMDASLVGHAGEPSASPGRVDSLLERAATLLDRAAAESHAG
jgi:hypothetical protein